MYFLRLLLLRRTVLIGTRYVRLLYLYSSTVDMETCIGHIKERLFYHRDRFGNDISIDKR